MRFAQLLTLTLAILVPATAGAAPPDLCEDVFLDPAGNPITDVDGTMLARFCEWTDTSAPVWGQDMCCSISATAATCKPATATGRCLAGLKMWCEYGEQIGSFVHCYQPLPDACAEGLCIAPPPAAPVGDVEVMCCTAPGVCHAVSTTPPPSTPCPGQYVLCHSPFTNTDGTVGCGDDD
jgi:hypothetical protein